MPKNCFLKLALFLATINFVSARLPITLINGLYDFYETNGLPHDSNPMWGAVAISSGLVESLRFYGNFDFKYGFRNNDDARDYTKDAGADSITKILKFLFPSAGGALSTETAATSNFGKQVSKNEDGARLLANLFLMVENLSAFQDDSDAESKMRQASSMWRENGYIKTLRQDTKKFIFDEFKNYFLDNSEAKKFYPKDILQKLVLAFVCEHFDTKECLEAFVNEYAKAKNVQGRIVCNAMLKADWVGRSQELKQKDVLNYENIFQLFMFPDFFSTVTGYSKATPVGHGNTNECKKDQDNPELVIDDPSNTFSDCAETSVRHLINILCFDPNTSHLMLNHIKDHRLLAFLAKYREKDDFNRGDIRIRTDWNKVVSCRDGIGYIRENQNELFGSLKNIFNLLSMFARQEFRLDQDVKNLEKNQKEQLEKICKILCGQLVHCADDGEDVFKENELAFTKINSIDINDRTDSSSIELNFVVEKRVDSHWQRAGFGIVCSSNGHAEFAMNNLTSAKIDDEENSNVEILSKLNFKDGVSVDLLPTLIAPEFSTQLFYKLFGRKLKSYDNMLSLLGSIFAAYENASTPFFLHNTCRNLINSINWLDERVSQKKFSQVLLHFLKSIPSINRHNFCYCVTQNDVEQARNSNEWFLAQNLTNVCFEILNQEDFDFLVTTYLKDIKFLEAGVSKINGSVFNCLKKVEASRISRLCQMTGSFPTLTHLDVRALTHLDVRDCKLEHALDGNMFPMLKFLSASSRLTGVFRSLSDLRLIFCLSTTLDGSQFPELKNFAIHFSNVSLGSSPFEKVEHVTIQKNYGDSLIITSQLFPTIIELSLKAAKISSIEGLFYFLKDVRFNELGMWLRLEGKSFPALQNVKAYGVCLISMSGVFSSMKKLYLNETIVNDVNGANILNGSNFPKLSVLSVSNDQYLEITGCFPELRSINNYSGKSFSGTFPALKYLCLAYQVKAKKLYLKGIPEVEVIYSRKIFDSRKMKIGPWKGKKSLSITKDEDENILDVKESPTFWERISRHGTLLGIA